jgi:hypothetical protein
VPQHGERHTVKSGESWWTLAELPRLRAAHKSASDLCYFNFKTRVPREVNWYLKHKVGCGKVTPDGKNYMFSDDDRLNKNAATPGIVYLPPVGHMAPAITPDADELRLDIWVGMGLKAGTTVAVAGIETMEGWVVSLDPPHRWMVLQASTNRLGAGWGASGGGCLIVVTGVNRPSQLNGFQDGAGDFSFALGEKWDAFVKGGGAAKKFAPILTAIARIGAKTPRELKAALKAKPDMYGALVKSVKQFKDSIGAAAEEQKVYLVDVPWGGFGAEVALFFGVANYTAVWDSN